MRFTRVGLARKVEVPHSLLVVGRSCTLGDHYLAVGLYSDVGTDTCRR